MKRKLLSILLTLVMCLGMLPGVAGAEETTQTGPEDKSGGWVCNDQYQLPTQTTEYTAGDGTITWEPTTIYDERYARDKAVSGTFTLNNASITVNTASSQGIYVPVDTELILVGNNTITVNQSGTAVMITDPYYGGMPSLTIRGEGSLTINASGGGDGIQVRNEINIVDRANVSINCSDGVGIFTTAGGISISDSTVKVRIADGANSRGAIRTVTNGYPAADLTIENSRVTTINPGGTSMMSSGSILFKDSDVVAIGTSLFDKGVPVEGILDFAELSGGTVTISGGTLYAENKFDNPSNYNYGFDLPVLPGKITATGNAILYYYHKFQYLVQNGNNIQYSKCSYDETTDKITTVGNGYVNGTVEWNDNIVFGATTSIYNYNGEDAPGNIIIPTGVTVTIPSGAGIYNYGAITNNGTVVVKNVLQNVKALTGNSGIFTNNGTLNVEVSGSVLSNGTITNNGTLNIEGAYNNFPTGEIIGGIINGVVLEYNASVSPKQFYYVAHGDSTLKDVTLLVGTNGSVKQTMTVPSGVTLTIPENKCLDASQPTMDLSWETLNTYLSVEGQIVVNGTLKLPPDPDQSKLDALLTHITGTGQVLIGESQAYPVTVTGGTADKSFAKAGETVTLTPESGGGKEFRGWTVTSGGVTVSNDNTFTMPGQAVTITAKYAYTVSFDSRGGSTVESQNVEGGGKATAPTTDPTRNGYTFDGWYTDAVGTTAYDFNSTVTGPLTLYAKWIPDEHTIIFDSQEGSDVASVQADYGTKLTKPADPTRSGYTFVGWYKEAECTNAWNFETDTVTGDVTLYAKWTEQSRPSGGGSSGGSSSGTSTLPVTTGKTTEGGATAAETTAKPVATVKGETAATTVSTAMGKEIVKQAADHNSETVVIAPQVTGDVTRTEVSIPASTVGQIGDRTDASLTVSTPVADVTIPNGGLASLSTGGGMVTVTAEVKGNTVECSITAGGETVRDIPGGVTVTVPVADAAPGTVAVLVRADGTREVVRKSVADGDSVTIPLDGSAKLEIVDNCKPFADVPAGSWEADAVAFASARGLFQGDGKGNFNPGQPMTRGMLAVVLHNLEGNPGQGVAGTFSDVDDSQWYAGGVAWAEASGIVGGYGNGQFGPNDALTREQLAVVLWRYAGSPDAGASELDFTDADQASDWAVKALRWATETGIMGGKGGGVLDPGGTATRAETAQMLKNFLVKR